MVKTGKASYIDAWSGPYSDPVTSCEVTYKNSLIKQSFMEI